MNIGRRISKIRKMKKIPQDVVCKGIVSRSHLSNIESGRYEPSADILSLLAHRLNIAEQYLLHHNKHDQKLDQSLHTLRYSLDHDLHEAKRQLTQIQKEYPYLSSVIQESHLFLLQAVYYIKLTEYQKAEEILHTELMPLVNEQRIEQMPHSLQELYYYAQGVLNYVKQNYNESYQFYLKQLTFCKTSLQKAITYHNIGLTLLKVYNYGEALEYVHLALNLYNVAQKEKKKADVHNLLGVLYWEIGELYEAEEHLQKAFILAEEHSYHELKGRIYHNYGIVYRKKGLYDQAILYLQQALTCKQENDDPTMSLTYRSLLNVYTELDDPDHVEHHLYPARQQCSDEMEHHYLDVIDGRIHLKIGRRDPFESSMKSAIKFFKQKKRWKPLFSFCEELGDYYKASRKYKQASEYYKLSLEAQKKLHGGNAYV